MKLLIDVTPVLNKYVPTEEEWISMFKSTIQREFGMADLDGEDLIISKLPDIKQKS